ALLLNVGAPFFMLSTTGPLVQAWFARLFPDSSPYRLYALSNLGSLMALLTYPFAVEPAWGLSEQLTFWRWGFAAYVGLALSGSFQATRDPNKIDGLFCLSDENKNDGRFCFRATWIALSAFSSAMFASTTEQLGHDIAVVPF